MDFSNDVIHITNFREDGDHEYSYRDRLNFDTRTESCTHAHAQLTVLTYIYVCHVQQTQKVKD